MGQIFILASNTFREIIRDRVLYAAMVFVFLFLGLSMALGELTFTDRQRITVNFGLLAMQLGAIGLAIFMGVTLVSKEIDKKTVMTLLARPLSRFSFLVGKSLGLVGVICTLLLVLQAFLLVVFWFANLHINPYMFLALWGVLLEALVLLGAAIFLSSFATPITVASICVGVFLIGHWQKSLDFFIKLSEAEGSLFVWAGKAVRAVMPNLETFNWRPLAVFPGSETGVDLDSKPTVELAEVMQASVYSFAWFFILVFAAFVIFRKKDFN